MAKRKLTVTFEGRVIGTRNSEHAYSHAVVLTAFDPERARIIRAREWAGYGTRTALDSHAHATEAQHPHYRYASVISDAERAKFARVAAMTPAAYVAEQKAAFDVRTDDYVTERAAQGATVLSYHRTAELARKAAATAVLHHEAAFTVVVHPVDAS